MMKNKIIILSVAALSLLSTSCNKFLDTKPTLQVPTSSAIVDYNSALNALTGSYSSLQSYAYYGRDYLVYGDVYTDNTIISPVNSNRFLTEGQWTVTSSTGDMLNFWIQAYDAINSINEVLLAIENGNAKMDETQQAYIKGQALAIRGMAHFDLVRLFGQKYVGNESSLGVPYMKVPIVKEKPARNTVAEVYTEAIADLKQAIEFLKVSAPKAPYYINEYGAEAILARLYMNQLDYASAKPLLKDVIDNGGFTLTENKDFVSMWTKFYDSPEFVFTISNKADDYGQTSSLGYIYLEAGYGDLRVPEEIAALFAPTDVRGKLLLKGTSAANAAWIFNGKFPNRTGESVNCLSDNPVMRISDVYLMYAECCAYTGDEPTAITYLDQVRQRADLTALATTATGDALKDAIFLERRKELLYEGQYLFDLKRYGMDIKSSYKTPGVLFTTITYPNTKLAMPIPQKEMDANPNMVQNPGY